MKQVNDPIKNGIIGLIVGDALGVPVEFQSRETLGSWPITEMMSYGTHFQPAGTWSDDSSLSLCLAEELSKEYNLKNIGESFVRWLYKNHWTPHGEVFDVGISTQTAIGKLKKGESPLSSGNFDENSNGNGSLMRILPLLYETRNIRDPKERYKIIKDVSAITHAHVRSCLACYYYLEFAAQLCLPGKDLLSAYKAANNSLQELVKGLWIAPEEVQHFSRLLNGDIMDLAENEIKSSGYVIHTLEASIWCLFNTGNYKDAALKAVNLGDDTDTTGAVTGGLAGIYYGMDSIPEVWLKQIARFDEIGELLDKLSDN